MAASASKAEVGRPGPLMALSSWRSCTAASRSGRWGRGGPRPPPSFQPHLSATSASAATADETGRRTSSLSTSTSASSLPPEQSRQAVEKKGWWAGSGRTQLPVADKDDGVMEAG